jgi:hypothetical protein
MIRTTITPQNTDVHISIPQDYVGRKMEVLLYATDELVEEKPIVKSTMAQFWGVISTETGEDMHKSALKSRNEWDRDI